MGTNRRRFVAATVAAFLAGCNERGDPEPEETVTPAAVPQSAADVLEDVEAIPVPTVQDGTIVSDGHRRAVIDRAGDRLETAKAELAAADGVGLEDIEGLRQSGAPFETARDQLRAYRDAAGPRRFQRLRDAVRDLGIIIGHVRAATGTLDEADLRTALERAQEAYVALGRGADYRLASPVIDILPTLAAAEAALDRASDSRRAAERSLQRGQETDSAPLPPVVAEVRGDIELVHLETTNAAGYLETTLDEDAPSRTAAISEAINEHLSALQELEVPRRPDGGSLPTQVRTVLSTTRARRAELFSAADPTEPESANRVELLLDAASLRGQLEAFDVAGTETFGRPEGDTVPADRLSRAKGRAVDRLETLSQGAPLQRHLGGLADDMVTFVDRIEAGMGNAPVASAHFMYVSGRVYAELSLSRGESLAERLSSAAEPPHRNNQ